MKSIVVRNWQPIKVHYCPITPNSWHHFLLPLAHSHHHFVQPPSQPPSPHVLEMVLPPFQLLASPQMCFAAQLLHCLHKVASCHEVVLDMTTGSGKWVTDTAAILLSQDWDSLMSHTGLELWIVQRKKTHWTNMKDATCIGKFVPVHTTKTYRECTYSKTRS